MEVSINSQRIDLYKKGRTLPYPAIAEYDKQFDVKKHKIFTNRHEYPDRNVEFDVWDEQEQEYKKRTKRVALNRIGLPYQKKIVTIAVTFFCGIPVKYSNDVSADKEFVESFSKVIDKNKTEFLDREIVTACSRWTECAELWFTLHDEVSNMNYGFATNYTLKCKILTPDENRLYPVFDENGDLIRFSFSYMKRDMETMQKIEVFKTYTAKTIEYYERAPGANDWELKLNAENPIGKIPVVYYNQKSVEWEDVQTMIERLEGIYCNTAESNDRFAFPILKIKGEVSGEVVQDKTGKVLQLEGENADADFVKAVDANQSLKAEKEALEKDIHDFTSTPNISFDKMQGLGNMLSGAGAEFLFLSAHLKVKEKMSIYVPAFQRRVSIIKSFLQIMNPAFLNKELSLTPVITPYVVNNDMEFFKMLMEMNGGEPLISQEESMRRAGIKEPEAMIQAISDENMKRLELENSATPIPGIEDNNNL